MNEHPDNMYGLSKVQGPVRMRVTVTGPIRKLCPYRDERDEGTATLTFDLPSGDAPELHQLAKQLDAIGDQKASHEDYTRALYATWQHAGLTHVETLWHTAGLEIRCAVPDGSQ